MSNVRWAAMALLALGACAHTSTAPSVVSSAGNSRSSEQVTSSGAFAPEARAEPRFERFAQRYQRPDESFPTGVVVADMHSCEVWAEDPANQCDMNALAESLHP